MKLSVVIPCYNEKNTIHKIVKAVKETGIEDLEIIVVDVSDHRDFNEIKRFSNLYLMNTGKRPYFYYIINNKVTSGALLSNFNEFYFSANRFLKNHPENNLYPKYLENHGYLPNSYGFSAGSAYNWTKNGGWIGRWSCPDGQGSCFGIGIMGNSKDISSIIKKYSSKAIQTFFPYPELYNPKVKAKGQLLMIFKKKIINRKAKN